MLYAIIGRDVENSLPARKAARPAHLERLRRLQAEGRLVLAGPFPAVDAPDTSGGVTGSLLVLEFESLEAAKNWADADPYVAAGVYAEVSVQPFLKVLPE
ncbi:MAG: hypothetical protein JWQ90_1466 [Hydrocarboniphaga sp.]|uniref:YciI family protein n=1 Tax=Hydrocarboniphaga sp. TaxID=2033016 RepID=UPI002611AB6C|nr:YciI family protein [Hydrocarboniphaga sp.]MDB5969016.1 hypothetical protein [Hydrocarboniphaga sp.]